MVRVQLDERQWSKVAAILNAERGAGRPAKDDRNFVEAVLWWRRTGWRTTRTCIKVRSELESTFSLLKQARRFGTRYEKTLRNYAAVVAIGCAWLWLRI